MANNSEKTTRIKERFFTPAEYNRKRIKPNQLFNLSKIGLNWDQSLIRSSLAMGTTESNRDDDSMFNNVVSQDFYDSVFAKTKDITRLSNDQIAFFDQDYIVRRKYLRNFSMNGEINAIIELIADEAIVPDTNNYFAQLDLSKLESHMKKTKESKVILDSLNASYKRVYQMFGWLKSNDAWTYMKKFLVDGYLAFEILFDYDKTDSINPVAKDIIGFKELDPVTLQPEIVKDETTGADMLIWYQFKDDAEKQRIIPDSNLIYISWSKGNFESRVSYLEGLTRTFNMLRQLENSRIIWNIQNAQKRIKIVVPIGTASPERAKARLSELQAYYNEDTQINDTDGTVTVNGQPKFSFNKTYIFPAKDGSNTDISEMGVEGYDLNSIDGLKYWWRRFILETKIPANRFMLDPTSGPSNNMNGDSNITREEYAFNRFIQRLQSIFKELLLKPTWIQFCLHYPLFANSEVILMDMGIEYNSENIFNLAKERSIVNDGASTVSTLSSIKDTQGKQYFSTEFLVRKYLGMSKEDLKLNEDFKLKEAKQEIDMQIEMKNAQEEQQQNAGEMQNNGMNDMGMTSGADMSGGMNDMGMTGGADMSGGMSDMSGGADMSGGMNDMGMTGGTDMSGGMNDMSGGEATTGMM